MKICLPSRLRHAWETFWYAPGAPHNLAAARIITTATALWVLLSRDLAAMSGVPAAFWSAVPWTLQRRYLLFPGHEFFEQVLTWITILALIGGLVGVCSRLCCCIASLLLYHLAPLEAVILGPDVTLGGFTIPVLALMILALSPCADVWSITACSSKTSYPVPTWMYHWPVRLLQVLVSCIYVFAGYGKLVLFIRGCLVGLPWTASEHMRHWVMIFNQGSAPYLLPSYGLILTGDPALFRLGWFIIVLAELSFPFVLVSRCLRNILVPAAGLFHLAVLFTMNIAVLFPPFLLLFVDWQALARRLAQRRSRTPVPGYAAQEDRVV